MQSPEHLQLINHLAAQRRLTQIVLTRLIHIEARIAALETGQMLQISKATDAADADAVAKALQAVYQREETRLKSEILPEVQQVGRDHGLPTAPTQN